MSKGYDTKSYGLIRKGYKLEGPNSHKYTAVANEGGITTWALHPKYFNQADTDFLTGIFQNTAQYPGIDTIPIDTRIHVNNVEVRGFVTHSEFLNKTSYYMPIIAVNNPESTISPFNYANMLSDITATKYAPFRLNYGLAPTTPLFQLNIADLPGIDLTADGDITFTIGDNTITENLAWLMANRATPPTLTVKQHAPTMSGFTYSGTFNGTTFVGIYDKGLTQTAVISDYADHMLKNRIREEAFNNDPIFKGAMGALGALIGGDGFNIVGGVESALDSVYDYWLREEMFADMRNQISNIGGAITSDMVGQEVDTLITVTYPVKKPTLLSSTYEGVKQYIYLADFQKNDGKSFQINSIFEDYTSFRDYVNTNIKGKVIGGNLSPVVDYGDYSKYFNQIISRGGLL